ncbi:MAG: hypothetical protein QME47_06655 [Candidatus Thermoplasmatota archaeon]|nr:hypothetical protein [Candidatus Thermoplasmatota archaeon]
MTIILVFLKSMGSIASPQSAKYVFDKGYDAATNNRQVVAGIVVNRQESHPQISNSDLTEDTYW